MECNAVATILVTSNRKYWLACRHLPKLDEAGPRGGAVKLGIWRKLTLRKRPLIAHLRHFCCHGLLEESSESVDTLLVLKHVLIGTLSAFPDESLIRSRDRPLCDLDTCFQKLLGALSVEEVLVTGGVGALLVH
jgi:hypothetical protein